MKYLGIDFGTKNIGVAISDDLGQIAFPKVVLKNNIFFLEKLKKIILDEKIYAIVVGESVDSRGVSNSVQGEVKKIVALLKQEGYVVHSEKEFWSSFEAHAREGKERFTARKQKIEKTKDVDAKAAAVILQRFLDRK